MSAKTSVVAQVFAPSTTEILITDFPTSPNAEWNPAGRQKGVSRFASAHTKFLNIRNELNG
jgi:hypothetical protein